MTVDLSIFVYISINSDVLFCKVLHYLYTIIDDESI